MHVHPGNGKLTLLSILSMKPQHTGKNAQINKIRLHACTSGKRKAHVTFHTFIKALAYREKCTNK